MRAILINPKTREITDVSDFTGGLNGPRGLYDLTQCDCVTTIRCGPDGETGWLDDEGLLKPDQSFFTIGSYPQPLAGNMLITGSNSEGDTVDLDPKWTVEDFNSLVKWLEVTPLYD